ncbi:MAG: T9SS type A sorting domain-containing protein [Saprospiraceae bacterium]
MMRHFTLILTFLCCYTLGFAQWTQVSSLPASFQTHHSFAFSMDGKGYMVTGVAANGNRRDFYEYDPGADQWTKLQDYPGPARGFGIGDVIDGKAYLGFGTGSNGPLNDLWSYDSTDGWTQLASCPCAGRFHPAMVANDGKIFIGMGNNNSGNLNDWWEYDIASNSWSQKPSFPGLPRHHPFQFAVNGMVYTGFGHGDTFISNQWYMYDQDAETWTEVASIPDEGRVAGTQFSHAGKGYILSGDGQNHGSMIKGEFWSYDPILDSWEELTAHPGNSRWAPSSFVLNDEVYIINGQSSGFYQSAIFKFQLEPSVSVAEIAADQEQLEVFPNPFQSVLTMKFNKLDITADDLQIRVYNNASQLLYQGKYQEQLDLSFLPTGLLLVEIANEEKVYRKLVSKL